MLRTRPAYAPAIRVAADAGGPALDLSEFDLAVLAAIAFNQPIGRDGLKDIFGREISRDLLAVDALLFLLSCFNAYLSLRTEGPLKRAGSWAADIFFLAGLLLMTAVCGLIAYSTV